MDGRVIVAIDDPVVVAVLQWSKMEMGLKNEHHKNKRVKNSTVDRRRRKRKIRLQQRRIIQRLFLSVNLKVYLSESLHVTYY